MHLMASYTFSGPSEMLQGKLARNTAFNAYGPIAAEQALVNLRAARDSYFGVFNRLGIAESAIRALNGIYLAETWDDGFNIPRRRL